MVFDGVIFDDGEPRAGEFRDRIRHGEKRFVGGVLSVFWSIFGQDETVCGGIHERFGVPIGGVSVVRKDFLSCFDDFGKFVMTTLCVLNSLRIILALLKETEHFASDLLGDGVAETVAVDGNGRRIGGGALFAELAEDVFIVQFCDKNGKAFGGRLRNGFSHEIGGKRIGEHHAHDAIVARSPSGIEAQLVEHGVAKKRVDFIFDKLFQQLAGGFFARRVHGNGDAD